jgi:halimadienyl-diphosphate synthase
MDYKREAQLLVQNLNQQMSPSAYDIAWLARLSQSDAGDARWPALLDWLFDNQRADGSWGGTTVYYHDRVITTLSALIALHYHRHNSRAPVAIQRAERYLWHHLHLLRRDPFELVGFELLLPTLLHEAQALGLDVPRHTCGYGEIQTAKLRLIPPEMLYSSRVTVAHSLEFLGHAADPDRLRAAQSANGSLGSSPAATAYFLSFHADDQRAWTYLETVQSASAQTVCLYPFHTFELTWVLLHLSYSGLPVTDLAGPDIWDDLQSSVTPAGLALDPAFGIADADCTSVGAQLLIKAGYDFDPHILQRFEDKKTRLFRTYDYERNISMGVNAHVLDTLRLMPDYPDRQTVYEEVEVALLSNRIYDTYWSDKWHASPYYATAHAVIALLQDGIALKHETGYSIDWLLHTQRADGSWGFFEKGTAEETAYALTALLHFHRRQPLANVDLFHRAADYLKRAYTEPDSALPSLYIGKVLFAPYAVIRAAILAALILYGEIFVR